MLAVSGSSPHSQDITKPCPSLSTKNHINGKMQKKRQVFFVCWLYVVVSPEVFREDKNAPVIFGRGSAWNLAGQPTTLPQTRLGNWFSPFPLSIFTPLDACGIRLSTCLPIIFCWRPLALQHFVSIARYFMMTASDHESRRRR